MMASVTQVPLRNCDGGHYCSPPKECCKQGCCYLLAPSVSYRPPTLPTTSMLNPLFLGHWYFWAAVTATVAGILCACSLWRRHSQRGLCCGNSGRDDRASEPDSNGSCYAPPHYSRCNSFHQAPPPYSEVTSKPDLYPLVLSYNGYNMESNQKLGRGSTGYLMVQYFRNYIVRPVGTLSATSTMDSLGSIFICNATNEANTIIPPPYSSAASLEEVNNSIPTRPSSEFPRSISSATCNDFHLAQHSPSGCSQPGNVSAPQPSANMNNKYTNTSNLNLHNCSREVSITSNPCYMHDAKTTQQTLLTKPPEEFARKTNQTNCDYSPPLNVAHKSAKKTNRIVSSHEYASIDCESQEEDHNFSDLLNLSVCIPSTITHLPLGTVTTSSSHSHDIQQYSVVNSITSSDISSLANLGTPDSPPRATSPTGELRELLDKIQQLPQNKSPTPNSDTSNDGHEVKTKSCFSRNKSKTLYMPLSEGPSYNYLSKVSPSSKTVGVFGKASKGWLSRSAPNTPCGSFVPSFPIAKKHSKSQRGSKTKIHDASPLLNENEESDDESQRNQCS
ncbi:hypothetical protein PPYR_11873 [Photinus pyralis]|uniref:WW domain binding protein VOPP1 n=1 Tax=Photinus pyralis TaxID=7054 RepID=A0A5N4ACJ2_PHOPY|nr:uncharacterized protein LOC116177178 [Photinus pyralis]XP_031352209.1 uncharacterized protein LOC116177377 [Photinus pyralis]KAB0795034.1 hypothetical protein PPYR_11873 [Photinus pyralis]